MELNYPEAENFRVKDTIGVPHPYCITPGHVAYASDNWGGMLSKECIVEAENKGKARCGVRNCNLSYEEHKQALLVECDIEDNEKLKEYLLSIKDQADQEGYIGFAFIKSKEN